VSHKSKLLLRLIKTQSSLYLLKKGTGKKESISITNDKGRLTKEEIDRMVAEGEKFAEEDKALKEKIDAKHQLENYIYQMRNTIEDKEKLADKIDADDKSKISDALSEASDWLSSNEDGDKDDFEAHLKELTSICDPIIGKIYQKQGGQNASHDDEEFEDLWKNSRLY